MFHKKKKLTEEQKQVKSAIDTGMKLYMNDAIAAFTHTSGCSECSERFAQMIEHAGSQIKLISHIPKCLDCQRLFNEIVAHTKGKIIDSELENKQDVSV